MNRINPAFQDMFIEHGENPYATCIQGIANEPICVHSLLVNAEQYLKAEKVHLGDISLEEIIERLVANRPRVAIIGGSTDHPAHLKDQGQIYRAAARIWYNGGVPFTFSIPIICDGTAQNNIGQSYSLASRNHSAAATNITFEGHSYHAAWVIAGCDKSPTGILAGLAAADRARDRESRDFGAVWASFAPAHVLRGGKIPDFVRAKLEKLIDKANMNGHEDLAEDIAENMRYILQCSSDEAFWGQVRRAQALKLIDPLSARTLMNELAAATCHKGGGICAFNGTGNSSRTLLQSLGFVPKNLELLCHEPSTEEINVAMDTFFARFNDKQYRVSNMLKESFENAVVLHSTTGSSTNMLLHMPAIMRYAGFDVSIRDYEKIRLRARVPELLAHSLTENRDTFVLAEQFKQGLNQGIESLFHVLSSLSVPLNLDAPTLMGQTWRQRIEAVKQPVVQNVGEKSVIRTQPIRENSGIDVLSGNFCSSAVIKISGMSDAQYKHFNQRYFIVRYYENEHLCNQDIMSSDFVSRLSKMQGLSSQRLKRLCIENKVNLTADVDIERLIVDSQLSFCFIIAGQGPKAYGMPEMFSPSQNLRHHQVLAQSSILLTDGRYSGVTKGACIGHAVPEAFEGGAIGVLQDGDVIYLDLENCRINYLDGAAFDQGQIVVPEQPPVNQRQALVDARVSAIKDRLQDVATSSRLDFVSHAEKGVVPYAVDKEATIPYEASKDV